MDKGKCLIVNLPERVLKDSGRLLGMMIVTRIYAAALQRPEGSKPWFLYADEFQSIASRSFLDLVTRSRKRGVGVILAHQNLTQPPFDRDPGFLDTVLANCATQVFFAVGRTDAERLSREVFQATGTVVKRRKQHGLWGDSGDPQFYSLSEEREHSINELEGQKPRECFLKRKGVGVWVAQTYDMPAVEGDGEALASEAILKHGVPLEAIAVARNERLTRFLPPSRVKTAKKGKDDAVGPYTGEPL
jgi:hypothetical protein